MPLSTSRMKASSAQLSQRPGDDVIELAGAAIALAVLHVLVHAEIQRRIGIGGGDDVPAGAAAADRWSSEAKRRAM